MSHMAESKVQITDIKALFEAIKTGCPELELRKDNKYRWYGRSVGDAAPAAIYQLQAFISLAKQGVDIHKLAKEKGVQIPAIKDIEKSPLSLADINKLSELPEFKKAFDEQNAKLGNDAEFVIGYKKGHKLYGQAYEIGVVPHPTKQGSYTLMADYWSNGQGLFSAEGLGEIKNDSKTGAVDWGQKLKQRYTILAMKNKAESLGKKVTKMEKLPDGTIQMEVE